MCTYRFTSKASEVRVSGFGFASLFIKGEEVGPIEKQYDKMKDISVPCLSL